MDEKEQATGKFFDSDESYWEKKYSNGLSGSSLIQVEEVKRINPVTVIDVGSGSGDLLIEMVKGGATTGIGVDLSQKLCSLAENKVQQENLEERIEIKNESFLESNLPNADVVSFHQVLCCHHDPEGMLTKAESLQPKAVVVTVPRSIPIFRHILNGIFWTKIKLFGGFRPYMHSQKFLDNLMKEKGYKLNRREVKGFWVLTTYLNEDGNKQSKETDSSPFMV